MAQAALPERKGRLILPGKRPQAIGGYNKHKQAIDAASGVTGWVIHDLRRTARSLLSRAGIPSDHAERCLGHVIGGVRGIYDRHEYLDEKARAFEALAVRHQRSLDRTGGLNKGEFLAHRNVHRSEDETANPTIEGTG